MSKQVIITAVVSSVVGVALGSAVTYFTVKGKIEQRANDDIAEIKEHYKLVRKQDGTVGILGEYLTEGPERTAEDTYASAQEIVRNYELIRDLQGETSRDILSKPTSQILEDQQNSSEAVKEVTGEVQEQKVVSRNLFEGNFEYEPGADDEPKLITRLEFETFDDLWDKESLTYFEGDDTLFEDLTQGTIPDIDATIGRRHLEMFGRWSGDPDVMFIQNQRIGTLYEVGRHPGYHAVTVLGLAPEDVGAVEPKARPQKMRPHE